VRRRIRRAAPELACFLLVTSVYLAHFVRAGYDRFYHDSAEYWELRTSFGDGFSLLAYDDPFRGYTLPLLNRALGWIADVSGASDVTTVEAVGGLLAATLGVIVLPRLARVLFSEAVVTWPRVLVLNALVFAFWRDHFAFPLSDFPAVLAACVGLIALFRSSTAGYLVAGLAFGVAANMRPAWAAATLIVLVAAALPVLRGAARRRGATAAVLVATGLVIVAAPQVAMNVRHHDTWSPAPARSRDISMVQLNGGLVAQRYETYIGPQDRYPRTKVFYRDPVASMLANDEVESYGEYLRLVATNPHRLAGSYVLHTFNGLHVLYPTPYVRDLRDTSWALSVAQYSIVFLAVLTLVLPDARRALGRVRWLGLVVLAVPSLTAIPGAMEPRFFLPVHLLAYSLVCFGGGLRSALAGGGARRGVAVGAAYGAFLALWLVLAEATQAQIEFPLD
jgi:hypothetical protein